MFHPSFLPCSTGRRGAFRAQEKNTGPSGIDGGCDENWCVQRMMAADHKPSKTTADNVVPFPMKTALAPVAKAA
jgi:hypothetical protein